MRKSKLSLSAPAAKQAIISIASMSVRARDGDAPMTSVKKKAGAKKAGVLLKILGCFFHISAAPTFCGYGLAAENRAGRHIVRGLRALIELAIAALLRLVMLRIFLGIYSIGVFCIRKTDGLRILGVQLLQRCGKR